MVAEVSLMNLPSDKCHKTLMMSTLVQVVAWCHQAKSHYLSQSWPISLSPNGVTRPQWVNWTLANKFTSLQWRHNDYDSVSNHQLHGCLLDRLFKPRSKKTPKLRVTGLCVGNSPGPVNSPHKGPVTRKMFPFDDVIMWNLNKKYKHFHTANYIWKWPVQKAPFLSWWFCNTFSFSHTCEL